MKIGVSGYFGYGNLGDDIFLQTWKQVFNNHTVIHLTGLEDIGQFDAIIVGGGDILIPNNFTSAYWRNEFLDKPTWVYGVGIPTAINCNDSALSDYSSFLSQCKGVYVRDKSSQVFIRDKGLYSSPEIVEDIAWAYQPNIIDMKSLSSCQTVGVSIRRNDIFDIDNIASFIAELSHQYTIIMIPLQSTFTPGWSDYDVFQPFVKMVKDINPNAIIMESPYHSSIDHSISLIKSVDYYVTQRMHGMLISIRVGTPVMAIVDHKDFYPSKFYCLGNKFGIQQSICNDNIDQMTNSFNFISRNWDVKGVRDVERSSIKQLKEFKSRVENS